MIKQIWQVFLWTTLVSLIFFLVAFNIVDRWTAWVMVGIAIGSGVVGGLLAGLGILGARAIGMDDVVESCTRQVSRRFRRKDERKSGWADSELTASDVMNFHKKLLRQSTVKRCFIVDQEFTGVRFHWRGKIKDITLFAPEELLYHFEVSEGENLITVVLFVPNNEENRKTAFEVCPDQVVDFYGDFYKIPMLSRISEADGFKMPDGYCISLTQGKVLP